MKNTGVLAIAVALNALTVWATAEDLSLDQCVKAGLTNSPDMRAATHRLAAAKAAVKEAESAYYPWVTASSTLMRSDNPPQAFMMSLNQRTLNMQDPGFDPNNPQTTDNLRGSVGLQYRVFDGGRSRLDRKMADLGADATGAGLEATRNELLHMITRSYYGAKKAKTFIDVQEEAVNSTAESLRVARERHKAGAALETDVLNLEVQLAQASEDLVRARNGFLMSLAALNTVMGSELATTNNVSAGQAELTATPTGQVDTSAAGTRPELKAMKLMHEISQKSLQKARRDYMPTINLFASSDWDSNVSKDFEQSYTVGLMAELNIFDGFRGRSSVNKARAQEQAAAADQEKVLNNLKLDITQAALEVKEAGERIEVTKKGVASAEQALKVTRERYQNGASGVVDLITAQTGLTVMKARDTAARYDYLVAISNLARAEGKLASHQEK